VYRDAAAARNESKEKEREIQIETRRGLSGIGGKLVPASMIEK